jgi:hypothetical protein
MMKQLRELGHTDDQTRGEAIAAAVNSVLEQYPNAENYFLQNVKTQLASKLRSIEQEQHRERVRLNYMRKLLLAASLQDRDETTERARARSAIVTLACDWVLAANGECPSVEVQEHHDRYAISQLALLRKHATEYVEKYINNMSEPCMDRPCTGCPANPTEGC